MQPESQQCQQTGSHYAATQYQEAEPGWVAGTGQAEQAARMRLQGQLLSSDMAAFKAANPQAGFQVPPPALPHAPVLQLNGVLVACPGQAGT